MKPEEEQQLIQIAQMYYMENKTQSEIAKELHIHRSTISRLLKLSRQEGIVEITIHGLHDQNFPLENRLKERYHLKYVGVVTCTEGLTRDQRSIILANKTNAYFQTILEDHMVLGFSWGATLRQVANHLTNLAQHTPLMCVPLMGGSSGRIRSDYHVNAVTYEASRNLDCGAILVDAPAYVESASLKDSFMTSDFMKSITEYWHKVDIAFLGVGSPNVTMNKWRYFYGNDFFKEVEQGKIAGDIAGHYFDIHGTYLSDTLDTHLISINKTDLARIPYRIGIAESLEKVDAIRGALQGRYINCLITTQETAKALLNSANL